jgi:hypothetical protein
MSEQASLSEQPAGWRLKLGIAMFGFSIALPLAGVPIVAGLGLSSGVTASVSGGFLISAEVLGIAAVAVMGKSGYAYIKNRILGFLKRYGPPRKVSRLRYRIGLVMFCLPILFGWLSPYVSEWIPGFSSHPLPYALGGDFLIVASLFVLGGDFWDKVRSLFIHNAEVCFSQGSNPV